MYTEILRREDDDVCVVGGRGRVYVYNSNERRYRDIVKEKKKNIVTGSTAQHSNLQSFLLAWKQAGIF